MTEFLGRHVELLYYEKIQGSINEHNRFAFRWICYTCINGGHLSKMDRQ